MENEEKNQMLDEKRLEKIRAVAQKELLEDLIFHIENELDIFGDTKEILNNLKLKLSIIDNSLK